MHYRALGKTGFRVSEIGFGAWAIGGGWGTQDDKDSIAALEAALERGVTLIDTAAGYGNGRSERLIAQVLKSRRDVVVATKTPPLPGPWPPSPYDSAEERYPEKYLRENIRERCRNLGVESIDVLQLHTWTRAWNRAPTPLEVLRKLKNEGLVRAVGVSTPEHDQNSVVDLMRSGLVDTVQVIYNIFEQEPAAELLPVAAETGTGILVRVVFDEGSLTGKFTEATKFADGDFRARYFAGDRLARAVARVEAITKEIASSGYTLPQVALKFALAHPAREHRDPGHPQRRRRRRPTRRHRTCPTSASRSCTRCASTPGCGASGTRANRVAGSNRLAAEKSPYLLQHASNPVDWYPWGEEALGRARREDRPIFLSVGYSTCHWCHVMERESFEDEGVARLLNETFVCIKVDREERPDIDGVYMAVAQMMTGRGGWPLTVLLTPALQPFYAATYVPRASRPGLIGMLDLVPRVADLWRGRRADVEQSASEITRAVAAAVTLPRPEALDPAALLARAFERLAASYDSEHGGFGSAPKFPTPHNLAFLLRMARREKSAVGMVDHTLRSMRLGGIWDHVGFGFHRYSTDAGWLVPHFEKMLYDQALMTLACCEAFAATGSGGSRADRPRNHRLSPAGPEVARRRLLLGRGRGQ